MLERILGALVLVSASTAPVFADPSGIWREKDGGIIRVVRCGQGFCATIVTVEPRLDPATGKLRRDTNNADASKRNRPLVGIRVLTAARPDGPGKWLGSLYDSDRGRIFPGSLIQLGPD